jgi:hypothetical protein
MVKEDLEFLFKNQLNDHLVHFIVKDDDSKPITVTHPTNELETLLPMLNHFIYDGDITIPTFIKTRM